MARHRENARLDRSTVPTSELINNKMKHAQSSRSDVKLRYHCSVCPQSTRQAWKAAYANRKTPGPCLSWGGTEPPIKESNARATHRPAAPISTTRSPDGGEPPMLTTVPHLTDTQS